MKAILHDWEDPDAIRILRTIRAAAGQNAKRRLKEVRIWSHKDPMNKLSHGTFPIPRRNFLQSILAAGAAPWFVPANVLGAPGQPLHVAQGFGMIRAGRAAANFQFGALELLGFGQPAQLA